MMDSMRKDLLCKTWLTPLTQEEIDAALAETDGSSPSCKAMKFCDAVFCVTDCFTEEVRLFPASRAFLATTSEHFERMLFGEMSEAKSFDDKTPIPINGLTIEGFRAMLAIGYGLIEIGSIKLDADNCVAVLQCADYFLATDFRDVCLQKLRKLLIDSCAPSTAIRIFGQCKCTGLIEIPAVNEMFYSLMSHHGFAENIVKSEEFKQVSPEVVVMILKADCSGVDEEMLWTKVVEWSRFLYEQTGGSIEEELIRIIDKQSHSLNGYNDSSQMPSVLEDYKSLLAQEHFNDFRDALAPLLPFFRFPCMGGMFFSEEVVAIEILNLNVVASTLRVIVGSSRVSTPFLCNKRTAFILTRHEKMSLLSKAFPNSQLPQLRLLYRGSEHGFSATKFHEVCNSKGPTLSVVETEFGHVLGGYTSLHWESRDNYAADNKAFLFVSRVKEEIKSKLGQLQLPILVHSRRKGRDIKDDSRYGPTFGSGYDLCISDSCSSNLYSYCRRGVYYKYEVDGQPVYTSWFVGNQDYSSNEPANFTVKEYEVFAVE